MMQVPGRISTSLRVYCTIRILKEHSEPEVGRGQNHRSRRLDHLPCFLALDSLSHQSRKIVQRVAQRLGLHFYILCLNS